MKPTEVSSRILASLDDINHTEASADFIIRLVQMISDPDIGIGVIASLIEREPSVSASLLRLANSAFFSRGKTIGGISQAIVHLGLDVVKKIVVAFEMFDLVPPKNAAFSFDDENFLKSSIAGSMLSDHIAGRVGLKEKGEAYACALLRDYGVLVLKKYFPDIFKIILETAREKHCPFGVACSMVCGFDHRHISSMLFAKWNLPSNFQSVSDQGISRYSVWVMIDKIIGYAELALKQHEYAQWDPYSNPRAADADVFSFNTEEFEASVKKIFWEVDEFMLLLSPSGQILKSA